MTNRVRHWGADIMASLSDTYLSVNAFDMELDGKVVKDAISLVNAIVDTDLNILNDRPRYVGTISKLDDAVDAALEDEQVSSHTAAFAASRAAIQAIQMGVSLARDHDIFSMSTKAGALAQLGILSHAYAKHAAQSTDDAAPTSLEMVNLIAEATEELAPIYKEAIKSRLATNDPIDLSPSEPAGMKI
jgi:hypothetical protein